MTIMPVELEHMLVQGTLLTVAEALKPLDFDAFIDRIDKAATLAPFAAPTLYRKNLEAGDPLAAIRKMAVAAKELRAAMPVACRTCGCTDERACPDGCSWIAPGLCSTCGPLAVEGFGR